MEGAEELLTTDHYYSFSSPVSDTCYDEGDLQGSRDHCSADPFTDAVTSFVNDNNDIINRLCSSDDSVTPLPLEPAVMYGAPPPIEYQMIIDASYRTERALQLLVSGQLIEGFVTMVTNNGLHIELTDLLPSLCCPNVIRQISDLRIKGLVKVENLATDPMKAKSLLKEYQVDDVVHGVITGVDNDVVQLTFCTDDDKDLKLGYVDIDVPLQPKLPTLPHYIDTLTSSTGFKNPSCVDNLKSVLGLSSPPQSFSLLRPILMNEIKEDQYFDSLRKAQRSKWSMETVASGVHCFKNYKYDEALKHFNYALEIDPENVEALVARGALFANKGKYSKGIRDFENALTINHTHSNAKKYLVETQTAYGRELEREGDIKGALRCYREALADNPQAEPAKTRSAILTTALEKKAAEQKEKEMKRKEEEQRLKKLQKIIEKERHHHKKHKRKNKKKSSSSKRHRQSSTSSNDSP